MRSPEHAQVRLRRHAPDVLHRLRQETRDLHDRVERLPILEALACGTISRDAYGALLRLQYPLHLGLDADLQRHLPADVRLAAGWRPKAPLLAQDLCDLGLQVPALAVLRGLVSDRISAYGALYVFEGALLGGQVVVRRLHKRPAFRDGRGLAFYGGYGAETGAHWQRTRAVLGQAVADGIAADDLVGAARAAFGGLEAWFAEAGHGAAPL